MRTTNSFLFCSVLFVLLLFILKKNFLLLIYEANELELKFTNGDLFFFPWCDG